MKKVTMVCVILVLSSTIVFSQHVHFGIDPGMALSRGSYKPNDGLERRIFCGF